jgi:hypothetical protein
VDDSKRRPLRGDQLSTAIRALLRSGPRMQKPQNQGVRNTLTPSLSRCMRASGNLARDMMRKLRGFEDNRPLFFAISIFCSDGPNLANPQIQRCSDSPTRNRRLHKIASYSDFSSDQRIENRPALQKNWCIYAFFATFQYRH